MIIVLKPNATQEQIDYIIEKINKLGLRAHISKGVERTIIGVIGPEDVLRVTPLEIFPGVEKVMPVLAPYKLVSREFRPESSLIKLGKGIVIGEKNIVIMAGPCAVESLEQLKIIASKVKEAGAKVLRGGAFKPRTSPYSFQGLGEEGLRYLKEIAEEFEMVTVSEVMDPRDVELVARYVDILQIGARNMQNFNLLKEVGLTQKPILLKRGMSSTIKEWLMSAEYILSSGNFNVILCERGIKTFEDYTRNTLDLSSVPAVKQLSHLPVIVDPSHGTGKRDLIEPLSLAAIAAGADGLLIEVHHRPQEALSDGFQSLLPEKFLEMMKKIKKIAQTLDKDLI
jgi:3-deoxy-7-phosphoheptulonate synthase